MTTYTLIFDLGTKNIIKYTNFIYDNICTINTEIMQIMNENNYKECLIKHPNGTKRILKNIKY